MATHPANEPISKTDAWIRRDLSVLMQCDDLQLTPSRPIPGGFEIRPYRDGDEKAWLEIHKKADLKNTFREDTFRRQFGTCRGLLRSRQFYLISPDGHAVGTASAWFKGSRGRIHWVAILPEFQGRGLSKPLLAAVCDRLKQLGHKSAYLTSSTSRIPALRLYYSFGFRPGEPAGNDTGRKYRSNDEAEAWEALLPLIAAPRHG